MEYHLRNTWRAVLKALQATQTSATLAATSDSPGNSTGVMTTGWEAPKNLTDHEVPQIYGLEALRNKPTVQLPPVVLLSPLSIPDTLQEQHLHIQKVSEAAARRCCGGSWAAGEKLGAHQAWGKLPAPNLTGLPLLNLSISPACPGTFSQVNAPPNGERIKF